MPPLRALPPPFDPGRHTGLIERWVLRATGREATGFAMSFAIHSALLLALSLTVLTQLQPSRPASLRIETLAQPESLAEDASREITLERPHPAGREPSTFHSTQPPRLEPSNLMEQALSEVWPGTSRGGGQAAARAASGGAAFNLPPNAVQAGNFAAWWIPLAQRYGEVVEPGQLPRIGQNYHIHVQIQIPVGRGSFRVDDLTGEIIGTDGYKQLIPDRAWVYGDDGQLTRATGRLLPVRDRIVEIVFKVTASDKAGVRDTIRIRSRLLNEEQLLTLEFQPLTSLAAE